MSHFDGGSGEEEEAAAVEGGVGKVMSASLFPSVTSRDGGLRSH